MALDALRQDDLERAGYRLQLRILAQILMAMANQTMTKDRMAKRLNCRVSRIRDFLRVPDHVADRPLDFREMSDAAIALGCEFEFNAFEPVRAMLAEDIGLRVAA